MTAEEALRERAAKELIDPEDLRGIAFRYLHDAMRASSHGLNDKAQELTLLAADLQGKAMELERR